MTRRKGGGSTHGSTEKRVRNAGRQSESSRRSQSDGLAGSFIWSYHRETPSEARLRVGLKKAGLRFGQEVPVKGFTVDFLVDEWLVVEVDGESHLPKGRSEKDASRQKAIEAMGFTVLRVPAGDIGSESGLKRWVRRIEERVRKGPPHMNPQKSPNSEYLRRLEEVRKALRLGEVERERREALAYGPKRKGTLGDDDAGETMEDYFGTKAEDFEALLEGYEWERQKDLIRAKEDEDDMAKAGRMGGRSRSKASRRRGGPSRR